MPRKVRGCVLTTGRPLRVALVSYRSKPHCGGQGIYLRHLSRELAGHQVHGVIVDDVVFMIQVIEISGDFDDVVRRQIGAVDGADELRGGE